MIIAGNEDFYYLTQVFVNPFKEYLPAKYAKIHEKREKLLFSRSFEYFAEKTNLSFIAVNSGYLECRKLLQFKKKMMRRVQAVFLNNRIPEFRFIGN